MINVLKNGEGIRERKRGEDEWEREGSMRNEEDSVANETIKQDVRNVSKYVINHKKCSCVKFLNQIVGE